MAGYVAASDIVQSLKGVFWIYQHCFDARYSANARYAAFASAIRGLDQAVIGLQRRLEAPLRISSASSSSIRGTEVFRYDAALIARAEEAFQSFKATLVDCEVLLTNNATLQVDRANFIQNIVWGASTQGEVEMLQRRISDQIQQINVLMSSIHFDEDHNMAERLDYLIHTQNNPVQESLSLDDYPILESIVDKFKQAALRDPPAGFRSPDDFPLDQGFKALYAHMGRCTLQSPIGSQQPIYQYVNLLKVQWILQTVKQLRDFTALEVWTREKRAAQKLENQIFLQLSRPDLTVWQRNDILRLPDSHFSIWDTMPMNVLEDAMSTREDEKEIFRTSLPVPPEYTGCELVVFRAMKTDLGTSVRVVRKYAKSDPTTSLPPGVQPFDSFKDILIPLYALPKSRHVRHSIELRSHGFTDGTRYDFNRLEDAFKFQWALTSFQVVSDFEEVKWTLVKTSLGAKMPGGVGSRIQIWVWDPDGDLELVATGPISPGQNEGEKQSVISRLTSQTASTILGEPTVETSTRAHTKYSNVEVVEAVMSYEPLIIIHTLDAGRYSYLCMQLSGNMYIDSTSCDCKRKPQTCRRTVLKNKAGDLVISKTYAQKATAKPPNLAVFSRSFRKGKSGHADLEDENCATKIKARHFVLDFNSVSAREKFNKHFTLASVIRQSMESNDKILDARARYVAQKPQGRGNPRDRILGTATSETSFSREGFSSPLGLALPQIPELDIEREDLDWFYQVVPPVQRGSSDSFGLASFSTDRSTSSHSGARRRLGTTLNELDASSPRLDYSPVMRDDHVRSSPSSGLRYR